MSDTTPTPTSIAPVERTITVDVPIDRAFDVFTRRLDAWWPPTHHVGPQPAIAVVEPHAGGRMYALAEDGSQTDWGHVLAIDPPHRFVFAWMLRPDWSTEHDPEHASHVTVTFAALSPSQTRVDLVHDHFENYADAAGAASMRAQVDDAGGWGAVLDAYASSPEVAA